MNIYALGNAIPRTINLTLTLIQESGDGYAYEASTSSKQLIGTYRAGEPTISHLEYILIHAYANIIPDDLYPLNDDEDFEMNKRMSSCLQIRIYRHSNSIPKSI